MFPRRDNIKIAVIGENDKRINDSVITWFENKPSAITSDFGYIIDTSGKDVSITFYDGKQCEIKSSDKELLLQQLLSLIVDEKYVDIDLFDISIAMKKESQFVSFSSKANRISKILQEWNKSSCNSAVAYVNGDFTLENLNTIIKTIESNVLIYTAKLDESMNGEVRVSLWY